MRGWVTAGLDGWRRASLIRWPRWSFRRWGTGFVMSTVSSSSLSRTAGSMNSPITGFVVLTRGKLLDHRNGRSQAELLV